MKDSTNIFKLLEERETVVLKKGQVIQVEGSKISKAYFVKKGLLKSYVIDERGKEHIFMFAPENWMIGDVESQEFESSAELNISCIEDSELIVIDRSELRQATLTSEQYRQTNTLLFRRIAVLQRRIIQMMSASAQSRYERFVEDYPDLPNRVPQKMIASYLGITPEALSKIKGQMVRLK